MEAKQPILIDEIALIRIKDIAMRKWQAKAMEGQKAVIAALEDYLIQKGVAPLQFKVVGNE